MSRPSRRERILAGKRFMRELDLRAEDRRRRDEHVTAVKAARSHQGELPGLERGRQAGHQLAPLADVVAAVMPGRPPAPRDTCDQLEILDRQLTALLGAAAPATWSSSCRSFWKILRAARREIRQRDRDRNSDRNRGAA